MNVNKIVHISCTKLYITQMNTYVLIQFTTTMTTPIHKYVNK